MKSIKDLDQRSGVNDLCIILSFSYVISTWVYYLVTVFGMEVTRAIGSELLWHYCEVKGQGSMNLNYFCISINNFNRDC